jgi:hypothetical protein
VSAGGDVDGDGFPDMIIAGKNGDPGGRENAGETDVVFGGAGIGATGSLELAALDGSDGFVLEGVRTKDYAGISVSGDGDGNGDGFAHVLVGAFYAAPHGRWNAGQGYVVFAGELVGSSGRLELASPDGSYGFALSGTRIRGEAGASVSRAGDVNGDGYGDAIIGANWADHPGRADAGQSYVVFGRRGLGGGGALDLAALDGDDGFVLHGIDAGDRSGQAVSGAGDINDDGTDDLLIGASLAWLNGRHWAGESYVVFGRAAGTDADGVPDRSDICTVLANGDQRDTDGDGNLCDPDLENDGIVNFSDLALLKRAFNGADPTPTSTATAR